MAECTFMKYVNVELSMPLNLSFHGWWSGLKKRSLPLDAVCDGLNSTTSVIHPPFNTNCGKTASPSAGSRTSIFNGTNVEPSNFKTNSENGHIRSNVKFNSAPFG